MPEQKQTRRPWVETALLCDQGIIDRLSGRVTLVNLFDLLYVTPEFLVTQSTLFARILGGEPKHPVTMECRVYFDSVEGSLLLAEARSDGTYSLEGRVGLVFILRFPVHTPGTFRFQILVDGKPAGEIAVQAVERAETKAPGG